MLHKVLLNMFIVSKSQMFLVYYISFLCTSFTSCQVTQFIERLKIKGKYTLLSFLRINVVGQLYELELLAHSVLFSLFHVSEF